MVYQRLSDNRESDSLDSCSYVFDLQGCELSTTC